MVVAFFHSKGSDFWKAVPFQRLWLFNVLFLATTVLVDGRRLYTFKRVWLLKGLSFQRVWLFNVCFYRRRPSQLMVVAFILSKGCTFSMYFHILKTFKGDHAQSSLCIHHPIKCVSFHHFKGSTQAHWSLSLIISIPESWNGIASRLIELRSSVVSVLRSLIASRGTTRLSHDQTTFCQSTGSLDDLSSCQSWVGPVLHYLRNRLTSLSREIYTYISQFIAMLM